jgi:hypothetical protein
MGLCGSVAGLATMVENEMGVKAVTLDHVDGIGAVANSVGGVNFYISCIGSLLNPLALLPEEIRLAARDYDPSRVNKYVTELAARFHKFYTVCRIKDVEPELMEARLMLADCVRRVIAVSLGIIGVSAPEKM